METHSGAAGSDRREVVAAAPRLMLHAGTLVITHPVTRERLELEAPVPFGL